MAITPNSEVHFLNVPLENNYKNQIYFPKEGGRSLQATYMRNHIAKNTRTGEDLTYYDLTYIRKDNVLKVPTHIDELYSANYVMYRNTAYTDRWFYAFITNMKYTNDGLTEVTIETDVWQTWFSDVTLKESFVEREHVMDDVAGNYRIDEELEYGDYITHSIIQPTEIGSRLNNVYYILALANDLDDIWLHKDANPIEDIGIKHKAGGGVYNNLYSGVSYYVMRGATHLKNCLTFLTDQGKIDSVTGIFIAPTFLLWKDNNNDGVLNENDIEWTEREYKHMYFWLGNGDQFYQCDFDYYEINKDGKFTGVAKIEDIEILKPSSLNEYTPRNKKLLTSPYRQLFVSNNSGGSGIYNYEDFRDDNPTFNIEGAITPGCSVRLIPKNYRVNNDDNNEHGVNLGKYPICSYNTDMYTNWLTQNGVSIGLDIAQSTLLAFTGINTYTPITTTTTPSGQTRIDQAGATQVVTNPNFALGLFGIGRALQKLHVASIQPYQARGNLNSGDVTFAGGRNTFTFYNMCIKEEFARTIDSFFDMFGYKVNKVKVPNISGRPCWNYVKTINCNIDGSIPQDDLSKIRLMFDNGVTFWKHVVPIEDYSNPEANIL